MKALHRTKFSKSNKAEPAPQPGSELVPLAPLPVDHVAIIMDGNRRWADSRHFPRLKGHQEGVKSLKRLVKHVGAIGLKYLTVYAFSSENWGRSAEEVNYLFDLFGRALTDEFEELSKNGVRLRFIGQLEKVPGNLRQSMMQTMESTAANTGLNLQVAVNYGARVEITDAMRAIARLVAEGKLQPEEINESLISSHLYTSGIPDPGLLIRTGGDMRLSNYLLWQAAYTEIFVSPVLWPEFKPEDFDQALKDFGNRSRRWGGD